MRLLLLLLWLLLWVLLARGPQLIACRHRRDGWGRRLTLLRLLMLLLMLPVLLFMTWRRLQPSPWPCHGR